MNHRPRSQIVLEEMIGTQSTPISRTISIDNILVPEVVPDTSVPNPIQTPEPWCSGRTVRQPDRLMFLGETYEVKVWLSHNFDMKDLGEANYILGIKLMRDYQNRMLGLSQAAYIDNILVKFAMHNSKKGFLPFRYGVAFSRDQCPRTPQEEELMRLVPYASTVGSLMYAMLCTRPDICYAVAMVSKYQSNPRSEHWIAVKHILKYLRRTRDYVLICGSEDLTSIGYSDSDFQSDRDFRKSTSGYVFTLGGGAISWRSVKQYCIADSTMEVEYVAAYEVAKEAVWLKKFLLELGVVPLAKGPIILHCDNSVAIAQSKDSRDHKKGKHIERKVSPYPGDSSAKRYSCDQDCISGEPKRSFY
ncbi:hypothetical protein Acr_00g0055040 [Actinidia rufa]|uniref:Reverse transcriptase Ty1/copia-type domain-containing protein n=1 Tax=Actinidia rufa TaxID=165716 RepID=A0A7J0DLT8_9ERIC|nr:hypothetical protein Acr_00g0055040 [Actinidia rufa]